MKIIAVTLREETVPAAFPFEARHYITDDFLRLADRCGVLLLPILSHQEPGSSSPAATPTSRPGIMGRGRRIRPPRRMNTAWIGTSSWSLRGRTSRFWASAPGSRP